MFYDISIESGFLIDRRKHLVAKLKNTRRATERIGITESHRNYKVNSLIPRIEAAISRIDSNGYGSCVDCEEKIPKDRLMKVPEALRCVHCQMDKDNATKNKNQ